MLSLDESFEIQSGGQDDWNFIVQGNYFCCHLQSEYTNTQCANMQRWILYIAQNYAMEWRHHFFKISFECYDSNIPLDEGFIYKILVDSSSWQQLLVNAS